MHVFIADAKANLMTVPPYACMYTPLLGQSSHRTRYVATAVVLTGTSWVSDRVQLRGPFVCLHAIICAVGYL